jgi:uncharacterized protein (DUF433 family)
VIQLDRITQDAGVMGGKACIRGMRVTVAMIVGQIGAGHTIEEILADCPYLEREDFCKRFGTLRGLPKTAKLSFLAHESACRYVKSFPPRGVQPTDCDSLLGAMFRPL